MAPTRWTPSEHRRRAAPSEVDPPSSIAPAKIASSCRASTSMGGGPPFTLQSSQWVPGSETLNSPPPTHIPTAAAPGFLGLTSMIHIPASGFHSLVTAAASPPYGARRSRTSCSASATSAPAETGSAYRCPRGASASAAGTDSGRSGASRSPRRPIVRVCTR